MRRYVDQKAAERAVMRAITRSFPGPADDEGARKAVEAFARWMENQPTEPTLIGAKVAAEIMGVKAPHISRMRTRGKMPEPIPVEGSVDAYIKDEVVAQARLLEKERAERARAKEE